MTYYTSTYYKFKKVNKIKTNDYYMNVKWINILQKLWSIKEYIKNLIKLIIIIIFSSHCSLKHHTRNERNKDKTRIKFLSIIFIEPCLDLLIYWYYLDVECRLTKFIISENGISTLFCSKRYAAAIQLLSLRCNFVIKT